MSPIDILDPHTVTELDRRATGRSTVSHVPYLLRLSLCANERRAD